MEDICLNNDVFKSCSIIYKYNPSVKFRPLYAGRIFDGDAVRCQFA